MFASSLLRNETGPQYRPFNHLESHHPFNLTRILMFNTPSAPLGKVFRRQELEAIAEVLRRHPQILIIADEARTLKWEHMFGVPEMVQVI